MNRGPVILAAVVGVLGVYLAYDLHSEKGEKAQTEQAAALFPFKPEQVNEFTLEKGDRRIHAVRTVEGWRLDEPLKDWADNAFADDFVDRVAKDKSMEFANEGPAANIDWKVYGLDRPAGKVTLKAQSGESRTVDVAEKHNFEGNVIARIEGEDKVRVLPAAWSLTIDRKPLEFRDKRLFRGKIGAVEKLDIHNAQGDLSLVRREGKWELPAHPDWVLDQNRIRELLSQVNETKATDFVFEGKPGAAEAAKLGLKRPDLVIRFGLAEGKTWSASIQKIPGKPLADVSEPANVLSLENSALEKLFAATAASLRDLRGPFDFNVAAAHEIRTKTALKQSTLRDDHGAWKLSEGPEPAKPIDAAKMKAWLSKVHDLAPLGFATAKQAATFREGSSLEILDEKGQPLFTLAWGPTFRETVDGLERDLHAVRTSRSQDFLVMEGATLDSISIRDLAAPAPAAPAGTDSASPTPTEAR